MSDRKALVVGVHHWRSPLRVGTHYITQFLLDLGFKVAHISAPVTPLHRLLSQSDDLGYRRANNSAGGHYARDDSLWHYVPSALLAPDNRPLLSSSLVLNYWQNLSIPNVVRKVRSAGFGSVDVLFLDSIYQSFWLSALDYKLSAYRLADNTSGFKGYSQAASVVEHRIMSEVDKVFTASDGLREYAETNGAKSVSLLPNGVDLERFSQSGGSFDPGLQDMTGPVAVYIGAFDYWFDHETIFQLAQQNPDLTIMLIGPKGNLPVRYEQFPNIRLTGPVAAERIPAYLSLADIGLIPFNVQQYPLLLNDVNPLKLYEYMAAGLPVVSNRWKELEKLNSPAHLVDNREQFIETVSAIIKRGASADKERHFAGQYDWKQTLRPLGGWIEGKCE